MAAGIDAVAGEDGVELAADQGPGAAPPAGDRCGWKAGVLGTVRFGHSESSWKTQRTPASCAGPEQPELMSRAVDDGAFVRRAARRPARS